MFQDVIKHHQRFDFERVPAVVELCWQAGANDGNHLNWNCESDCVGVDGAESLSSDELILVASGTLRAWDILRNGVEKLLMVYPAKVCKHCSEIHVGPSGHKARLCGIFKYESWQGTHFWRKANVDDLVPPKTVWRRRPQDPQALLNEGRGFYGHAPAVVELCTQAGAIAPPKYHCMMKLQGVSTTLGDQRLLHPNDQMKMPVDSKIFGTMTSLRLIFSYRITVLVHINVYCDRLSPDASEAIASTHRLCSSLQFHQNAHRIEQTRGRSQSLDIVKYLKIHIVPFTVSFEEAGPWLEVAETLFILVVPQ
ncbi:hypothetical protein ACFXTH_045641 [Malus domestica]